MTYYDHALCLYFSFCCGKRVTEEEVCASGTGLIPYSSLHFENCWAETMDLLNEVGGD